MLQGVYRFVRFVDRTDEVVGGAYGRKANTVV